MVPALLAAAPPAVPTPFFTRIPDPRNPGAVALSADGRLLALLNEPNGREKQRLEVWDVRSGRCLLASPAPSRAVDRHFGGFLAFTPDDEAVVLVAKKRPETGIYEARVVEVPSGKVRKAFDLEPWHGQRGYLLAGGRRIVVSTATHLPAEYDLETGKRSGTFHPVWAKDGSPEPPPRVVEPDGVVKPAKAMALSPDGRRLATSNEKGWIALWDVEKRTRLWQTRDGERGHESLAFTPDGRSLASLRAESCRVTIHRTADGGTVRIEGKPFTRCLAYLPNGLLLLGRNGRCGFAPWDTDWNEEPFPLWTPCDPLLEDEPDEKLIVPARWTPLTLSADGSTLALIKQAGGVLVFDVRAIRSPRKK